MTGTPSAPLIVGSITSLTDLRGVAVSGNYAYVTGYITDTLTIIDVSNPSAPTIVGSVTNSISLNGASGVTVSGGYAYVTAQADDRLTVVDVSSVTSPTIVGSVSSSFLNEARTVRVSGGYAYVTGYDRFVVVDVSTPSSPVVVSSSTTVANSSGLVIDGTNAYISSVLQYGNFGRADISNPLSLSISVPITNAYLANSYGMASFGPYVYVPSTSQHRVSVIDISTPSSPVIVGSVADSTLLYQAYSVAAVENYVYVVTAGRFTTVDVSTPSAPFIAGSLENSLFSGLTTQPRDIAVSGDYAYVVSVNGFAVVEVLRNNPPLAPTLTAPVNGITLDRQQDQVFTWDFNDPDELLLSDSQSAYNFAYRLIGATSWAETGWVSSTSSQHTVLAGTLSSGDYEWRVATKDSVGSESPWSSASLFYARNSPLAPTITDPANNSVISSEEHNVSWSAPNQAAFQIQVLDASSLVVYDTSQVNDAVTRTYVVPFPDNLVTRTVRVRVFYDGLWSTWSAVVVSVSYTHPLAPVLSVAPTDVGLGLLSGLLVTIDDPVPGPAEPTVVSHDVWVREQGTSGDGICIAAGVPAAEDVTWYAPAHGVVYEVRVKAVGDNSAVTWSGWYANGVTAKLYGVVLHDPLDPAASAVWLRYNGAGSKDDVAIESTAPQYTGETYPEVVFGNAESRTVEVPLVQIDDASDDWSTLVRLIRRRTVLCYRDSRGRKVFGVVTENSSTDVHYGVETSLTLTETDYVEGLEAEAQ